ncbi:protein of unknown function [Kyrpidia spormannii]|uniref:Uncharacterized protein n=1 Tax=Kyrpidia spormannii TaxID=2055160 RepID=A0ACA8Z816_9BACL|nr:protein of unknown function [Kyrpidia spormannii]
MRREGPGDGDGHRLGMTDTETRVPTANTEVHTHEFLGGKGRKRTSPRKRRTAGNFIFYLHR